MSVETRLGLTNYHIKTKDFGNIKATNSCSDKETLLQFEEGNLRSIQYYCASEEAG